jgi:hypothetical protein
MKGNESVYILIFAAWFVFLIGLSLWLENRNARRRNREVREAAERGERMYLGSVDWQDIRLFAGGWIGILAIGEAWRLNTTPLGWAAALVVGYAFTVAPFVEMWVHWRNRTLLTDEGMHFHVWGGLAGLKQVELRWDAIERISLIKSIWRLVYIEDAVGQRYKPLFGVDFQREVIARAIAEHAGLVEAQTDPPRFGGLHREARRWVQPEGQAPSQP